MSLVAGWTGFQGYGTNRRRGLKEAATSCLEVHVDPTVTRSGELFSQRGGATKILKQSVTLRTVFPEW